MSTALLRIVGAMFVDNTADGGGSGGKVNYEKILSIMDAAVKINGENKLGKDLDQYLSTAFSDDR